MIRFLMTEPYRLLFSGLAAIAILTAGVIIGISRRTGRNVLQPRQFTCERVADAQQNHFFWTVMYQGTATPQPWLRMVAGMEGKVSPEAHCERIAERLDVLSADQLQILRYQSNPATPDHDAVCVTTAKNQGDDCETLIILQPHIPTELFFAAFTAPLQPTQVTQATQAITSNPVIETSQQGTSITYTTANSAESAPTSEPAPIPAAANAPAPVSTPQTTIDLRQYLTPIR